MKLSVPQMVLVLVLVLVLAALQSVFHRETQRAGLPERLLVSLYQLSGPPN